MPLDLTDDKSTLVQVLVMVWCRQATSHYLSQCWPRSMSPNGVTRPQGVNSFPPSAAYMRQWIRSALVQIMACRLFGAKPLHEPMLFIHEIASENIVCDMAAILCRGRGVNDTLRLVNELSSLAATCLLRSVSKVQTLEAGWIFPTGTDLWCACLTFCPPSHSYNMTSYPTRRHACGGGAAADETKISGARFVEKRQWFRGDMIYANQWEYFTDHCKSNCFAEILVWEYFRFKDHTVGPSLQNTATPLWFNGKALWVTTKIAMKNAALTEECEQITCSTTSASKNLLSTVYLCMFK